MKFEKKLKKLNSRQIWQDYCGFLDLTMDEYMNLQKRLMEEQIELWKASPLGQSLLDGKDICSIDDLRTNFPLTTYEDYADVLLLKRGDMLPDEPIVWIQTTWEGGRHPIKLAPYSKSMLDIYKNNVISCMLLSTSTQKGEFNVGENDMMLYGLAPLPYATGLLPLLLGDETNMEFLPPVKDAQEMSFSERNKQGFKLGMKKGIDFFFAVSAVTYYISSSFGKMASGSSRPGSILNYSLGFLMRYLHAKKICKNENREMMPKDIFKLKGFLLAGTDNHCYKDDLERLWGIRPMELFAGTECGCMASETWMKNGMYLFPDACFYEFIPEDEMYKSMEDPSYQPVTCLLDEVRAGGLYELVISTLKGGAFMRYRVGDVYRCLSVGSMDEGTVIPKFEYLDRIPSVIDIAGFTRITEYSITQVLNLSGLPIRDWFACKEFSKDNRPYMHMYVEPDLTALSRKAFTKDILKEHLSVYFKYLDNDYLDLKKILGIDPLQVTIIKAGTFESYIRNGNKPVAKINPKAHEKMKFLRHCGLPYIGGVY